MLSHDFIDDNTKQMDHYDRIDSVFKRQLLVSLDLSRFTMGVNGIQRIAGLQLTDFCRNREPLRQQLDKRMVYGVYLFSER